MIACEICGKECKSDKSFEDHMKQHENGIIGKDGKVIKARERGFRKIPRDKRVPFNKLTTKMNVSGLPDDVHACWMEDDGSMLQRAGESGYLFIDKEGVEVGDRLEDGNDSIDSRVSMLGGGIGEDGQPVRMYLMGIHKDSYEEDRKAEQDLISGKVDKIKSGEFENDLGSLGYVSSGTKIE